MRKVLHADIMQLSSRSLDCWSYHILSAMEGLAQSCMFKQKLLISVSLSWTSETDIQAEFWTPFSDGYLKERNSRTLTHHLLGCMRVRCGAQCI